MKHAYQRMLDETLEELRQAGVRPRLLLHSCCGPCSSYVLEYLSAPFDVTVLFYNPNIYPAAEYDRRAAEQRRLICEMALPEPVGLIAAPYEPQVFDEAAAGLEAQPEGGARCLRCFALRLEETARQARDGGFDYFTTTLSVGPRKDAGALAETGAALAEKYGVRYLYSDFKKKNGYKRSVELSELYGLYRQDYCGCRYSLDARPSGAV